MKKVFLILTLCFLSVSQAQAAVPKLLTYQGFLKNSAGSYLSGTYAMTFRIYSASTGGTALWTETQSSVTASSGKFSVQLGSVTALSLDFSSDYWLSMQVGSDAEMSPRVRLTSMGYGIRADYETNGFTQAQHDALSHENIPAVKENSINIVKTNFKLDAYAMASANSMNDLMLDTFNDASGIDSTLSAGYALRVSPYYDVTVTPGGIDANVKLLLHGNGADASNIFTDSSSTPKTITAFGNAQIDTAQSKFASASALFDGAGDYLTIPDSADWDFGTGDFTIDFQVRFNTIPIQPTFVDIGATTSGAVVTYYSNTLYCYIASSVYQFSWTPSTGTWYHVALVRSGANLKAFINGVQIGSTLSNSSNITGVTQGVRIGNGFDTAEHNGWLDEVRISNIARWTSNFTPPASEYTLPASTATVISNAYAVSTVPTEAIVIPDETLGTGSITYYVSRDNGTTWTVCTKEIVTNISSQPSGTQVKWKAVITGNAELNAIGVAV